MTEADDLPDAAQASGYDPSALRLDLYGKLVDRSPYFPDPDDPTLNGDQVMYHLAFGAKPEDFDPAVQPLARSYGIAFQPRPPIGPGLLGSLDDIKAAIADRPTGDVGDIVQSPPAPPVALDTTLPDLHIPSGPATNGLLGLRDVDGLPIQSGSRAIPRFDGSIADNVSSFFGDLRKQKVPIELTGGFRAAGAQAKYTNNKYGGAKPGSSLHEAGLAFDVNWTELSPAQRSMVLQSAKKLGFKWGGNFNRSDVVHFYVDPFQSLSDRRAYIQSLQQGQ